MGNLTVTQRIRDEFKTWSAGENIILDMAMGRGKTFFVVNVLGEYAEQEGKKILYLCNRSELAKEVFTDIKETWGRNITVKTYQSIQREIQKGVEIEHFDYVVCDEIHYLFSDAWNDKTDIMYKWLKDIKFAIKLFMSATGKSIFQCIKNWGDYTEYIIEPDYSYIEKIVFYDDDQYIDRVIEQLEEDEKVIYFSREIENAYQLHKKYTNSSFVCSRGNTEYKQYITKDALRDNKLTNKITFTTSVWDNGINIKDDKLKHIICNFEDLVILIQSIGRKRVGKITKDGFILDDNDKVTLHIKHWSKQNLTQFINPKRATIKEAKKFMDRDEEWIAEQIDKRKKYINECLYVDYEKVTIEMNHARFVGIEKEVKLLQYAIDYGFDKYVLKGLGDSFTGKVEYIFIKEEEKKSDLEKYLNTVIGEKLYKQQQKELATVVNTRRNGRLLKSVEAVIGGIKDEKLNYTVIADTDWDRTLDNGTKNPNRGKVYWMIVEVVG
nr:MAG TPA: Chromatin remodeling complex ATPase [Caudoviricetes sp.]